MAVLSLPLTFTNSFWTQDYRKGLEVLYAKLEQVFISLAKLFLRTSSHLSSYKQGVAENDEIVTFVRVSIESASLKLSPPIKYLFSRLVLQRSVN